MLVFVFVGIVMTIIMQSSSAAIVITLSALTAQALSFEQAAALVIGQNVGTTVKAFIASIGGAVPAKRTAMAHILFNLFCGMIAFLCLPLMRLLIFWLLNLFQSQDLAIVLTVFNTLIYVVGVLVILPLLPRFTQLLERLVPGRSDTLTQFLDPSVATILQVALEAVRRTLIEVTKVIAAVGAELFMTKQMSTKMMGKLEEASHALAEVRTFLSQTNNKSLAATNQDYERQVSLIHVIDHLARLLRALEESSSASFCKLNKEINNLVARTENVFKEFDRLSNEGFIELVEQAEKNAHEMAEMRRKNRKVIIETTVLSQTDIDDAIQIVHTIHWIDRIAYHLWRTMRHLKQSQEGIMEEEEITSVI
ncbi:hypothetical protein BEP19_15380 [Ammoniphilus oxalaticus]|uniref:PhoU domain-containing protein n=2 Tax=Ammoniphilus oxalaticus TaxID=66863 RepID=A0A419SD81_9BACL|nr:hypothetical protein BEP19_15380 [Ammoniphilus oxalaticus]